ncbi:MAG: hypothetical protein K8R21_14940 [Leptospira sp.]|nr:hypothetical protein [Leptospira sp.]
MNNVIFGILFSFLILHGLPVFADRVEGIVDEFTKVEDFILNRKPSNDYKKKNLERNILSAVRLSLHKRYLDFDVQIKEMNMTSVSYEIPKDSYSCYVRYKQYYIYYGFAMDPELYLQSPIEEKFYVKPEGSLATGDSKANHPPDSKTPTEAKKPEDKK